VFSFDLQLHKPFNPSAPFASLPIVPSCSEAAPPDTNPRFSIVVPCFNQGRYLTDCLESLAIQDLLPFEVIVVNDGSTDEATNAIIERLPLYSYPFPVSCVRKPNGGLSSARNCGVAKCSGDIIVPLDADDVLFPHALAEYAKAFHAHPEIDVFYPDITLFGNQDLSHRQPHFNTWRLVSENLLVCCSPIRRRVFDAGYSYDERMRRGYEDWEFWIRTCALGPFKAAALQEMVFGYRKWGFSMISAVNHENLIGQIRSLHTAAGIWSPDIDRELRKVHASTHRLVAEDPSEWAHADDLATVSQKELVTFLEADRISRFLWIGAIPPEAVSVIQLVVNEIAAQSPSHAYVFLNTASRDVDLVVLDRLTLLRQGQQDLHSLQQLSSVTTIHTDGDRHPLVRTISKNCALPAKAVSLLTRYFEVNLRMLPASCGLDTRIDEEVWYFFSRAPQVPRVCRASNGGRTLAIAMPFLTCGGAEIAVRLLLEEGTHRRSFDRVLILTFLDNEHVAHSSFEPLADAIVHLGQLGLNDERKMALALEVLEAASPTDLLIANSEHGYHLLPRIRKAGLSLRVHAQVHNNWPDAHTGALSDGYPRLLASQYAALIDRVASISDAMTAHMIDELYFPPHKVRTVRLGVDQTRFYPRGPIEPSGQSSGKQVLWCGRLGEQKDPLLALQVVERFQQLFPNVRFVFVGNGPLAIEFGERFQHYKDTGASISWIKHTDQVQEIMRQSDCLLMTSAYEGIPIVVMEAFSCGLPVVMCLVNSAAGELATSGQLFAVTDRLDLNEYCEQLRKALDSTRCIAPDPALSLHRYASELIDWLFSSEEDAGGNHLNSVFGVVAAA
jgi:glycosyltransferase involved in cell wall biosynthesis